MTQPFLLPLALSALFPSTAVLATQSNTVHVHEKHVTVVSGQTRAVDVDVVDRYRPYELTVTLEKSTEFGEANGVRVELEGTPASLPLAALTEMDSSASAVVTEFRDFPRILISPAGEMGAVYRVRVAWRALPSARMMSADYMPSPNFNQRPAGAAVDTVIVHATVTPTLLATVNWFMTPRSEVSAHYVVGRDGTIVQMVDDTERAWHAGVSVLEGRNNVNHFSIGIEIVNLNDGRDPFADAQYAAVASIIRHLREQYDIPDSHIVSHAFIARPVGRKSDPLGFDFDRLKRMCRE